MRLQQVSVLAILVCGLLATAGIASAETMGTQFDGKSGVQVTNTNTVGWRFGLTDDILVTQLGALNGVYTPLAGDDSRAGATHDVGIYSEASQSLLASATVTNGAAGSTNQWSWTTLGTPLTLNAGSIYRIATYANSDNWTFNTANHSVGPEILIGTALAPGVPLTDNPGSRVAAYAPGNNVLQYPWDTSVWDITVIYDGLFGPNFKYELAPPPPPSTTLFFDDFEHGDPAGWDLIGTPVVPVGSWSLNGGTTGNNLMAYWATTGNGLPTSIVFGGTKYGATIRGGPDVANGVVTNADAQFAVQSNASDLVSFEADFYGQPANSTPVDLELSILSGLSESNTVELSGGSSIGSVSVGGVATAMTYALNQWHHLTMEYYPTTSTFTLTIDDQSLTDLVMTTPSTVDGFRFTQTSAGQDRWSVYDNVEVSVTPIPEPSALALLGCGLLACGRRKR